MTDQQKLSLLWFLLILLGVLLALFFGPGWLFLALTLRRALQVVPLLRRWVHEQYLGLPPRPVEEETGPQRMSRILGYLMVASWAGLTLYAFLFMNVPLIELFRR